MFGGSLAFYELHLKAKLRVDQLELRVGSQDTGSSKRSMGGGHDGAWQSLTLTIRNNKKSQRQHAS